MRRDTAPVSDGGAHRAGFEYELTPRRLEVVGGRRPGDRRRPLHDRDRRAAREGGLARQPFERRGVRIAHPLKTARRGDLEAHESTIDDKEAQMRTKAVILPVSGRLCRRLVGVRLLLRPVNRRPRAQPRPRRQDRRVQRPARPDAASAGQQLRDLPAQPRRIRGAARPTTMSVTASEPCRPTARRSSSTATATARASRQHLGPVRDERRRHRSDLPHTRRLSDLVARQQAHRLPRLGVRDGTADQQQPGAATEDSDIFVVNVDDRLEHGTPPRNLTNDPARVDDDPDWSPDGNRSSTPATTSTIVPPMPSTTPPPSSTCAQPTGPAPRSG